MPEVTTAQDNAQQGAAQRPRVTTQATPMRMRLAEIERHDWVNNAEFGTTLDDVKEPGYWAHMAKQMTPYDHIECRVDDSTWLAHLLVLEVGRNWARVMVLNHWRLDGSDVAQTILQEQFRIDWKGPQHKFAVIRVRDNAMISKEHRTREQAQDALRNFERTLGAAT